MKEKNIYKVGVKLGLKNDEINLFLREINKKNEQSLNLIGPFIYPGTHYGSISIKDF